eukprot:CAMPEP_0119368726 /NCGR_PEP_ID=MMETSP1334-20130426/15343_1 /TAXON_ID=127549 /ORGANISM="Calcidiscus leptoporus, Strain RCC1130" /LENGTH=47 /DNA_ID= /DNA_START= /DNA_END= /DNA_ORIENTATION=
MPCHAMPCHATRFARKSASNATDVGRRVVVCEALGAHWTLRRSEKKV